MKLSIKPTLGVLTATATLGLALSTADVPADIPVAQLITSASAALSQGNAQDALIYFDIAVTRDPQNYLTLFRRGAAYLQLGKHSQANHDFDRVLAIKPTFEGALIQRAKIKSRNGDWELARKDYTSAGHSNESEELKAITEAQTAESLSADAEAKSDWVMCTTNADIAIQVAAGNLKLRQRRARCRIEKAEFVEGLNDLVHVAQLSSSEDAFAKLAATYFYALNEPDNGLAQIKRCMHSDPDSKICRPILRNARSIDKTRRKVVELMEKRQYNSASKLLVTTGDDKGLLEDVKSETQKLKDSGVIPPNAPSHLYTALVETTCETFTEMNNFRKAQPFCDEALTYNPNCLPALIGKATRQLEADLFEDAIRTLNVAKEAQGNNQKVNEMLQKAHTLLKRSKTKDYYKILGLARDADARDIKKAWRKMGVRYHPDKAGREGISQEEAQTKMAAINEAYEVLSDPELKQRFDNGDDPNDPNRQGNPFQGSPFGGHGPGGQPVFFQQGGQQFKFQGGGGGGGGFNFPGGFPF